jgi:hypothetical protein
MAGPKKFPRNDEDRLAEECALCDDATFDPAVVRALRADEGRLS